MTGGQFSLVRVVFGAGVASSAGWAMARSTTLHVGLALAFAVLVAGVLLALGAHTRAAAALIATVVVVYGVLESGLDWANLAVLLALAPFLLAPDAPYLSWKARGKVDPRGSGPPSVTQLRVARYAAAALFTFGAVSTGNTLLDDSAANIRIAWARLLRDGWVDVPWHEWSDGTLQAVGWLGVALLFVAGARLWGGTLPKLLWILVLVELLVVGVVAGFGSVLGALVLMLLVFEPRWLPARRDGDEPALVFYDGHCGLCHRTVRLLLAEDATGDTFRFSPLQGATFPERVEARDDLPDSVLVLTPDGRLLMRSSAAIEALWRLGGFWRALGHALWLVPRPLRDLGYAGVAKVRKAIFGAPEATCPIIPADLGPRFLP